MKPFSIFRYSGPDEDMSRTTETKGNFSNFPKKTECQIFV